MRTRYDSEKESQPWTGVRPMKQLLAITLLCSLSVTAHAQIFKCVKPGGGLEFSSIPCSADVGDASLAVKNQYQPSEADMLESEVAHLRNQASAQTLSAPKSKSGVTKVTVVKDSAAPVTTSDILRSRMERRAPLPDANSKTSGVTVIKDSSAPVTMDDLLRSRHGIE